MYRMKRRIKLGILFIPIFIGGLFLFNWAVMLLWNAILPAVLGVKAITFWQALGILVLSKILFGFNSGWGGRRRRWRDKMEDKWHTMNPDEREKFRAEWKDRCGGRWGRFSNSEETASAASE